MCVVGDAGVRGLLYMSGQAEVGRKRQEIRGGSGEQQGGGERKAEEVTQQQRRESEHASTNATTKSGGGWGWWFKRSTSTNSAATHSSSEKNVGITNKTEARTRAAKEGEELRPADEQEHSAEDDGSGGVGEKEKEAEEEEEEEEEADDEIIVSSESGESEKKKSTNKMENFFAECNEINRYTLHEVIGKGSYGVVSSATDRNDGSRVAIKKITDVFENVSDATRILREIKLLRLLKHRDIVGVHSILLPPDEYNFKDIYVVFKLFETDLHQVIKANDDMTIDHYRYFLYQLLRGLKYIHSARVYHRDLKPKNILINSDCKLKICDFGLARPMFDDSPQTVFWTDYVATRWYRAPELCGSFFTRYSPSVDIWSIGCIFAEIITRKPLFPGKNVVDQLQIITDLVGTPNEEEVNAVRNDKARRFLQNLPPKPGIPFAQAFPGVDENALDILKWMLAFDPKKRPTPTQALEHPFLKSLHNVSKEPECTPVSKLEFGFEFKKMGVDDVRKLIYREILEYHPNVLREKAQDGHDGMHYVIPDAADRFRMQFSDMELNGAKNSSPRAALSMPAEKVRELKDQAQQQDASG